jgi:hypothetical protein
MRAFSCSSKKNFGKPLFGYFLAETAAADAVVLAIATPQRTAAEKDGFPLPFLPLMQGSSQ